MIRFNDIFPDMEIVQTVFAQLTTERAFLGGRKYAVFSSNGSCDSKDGAGLVTAEIYTKIAKARCFKNLYDIILSV